MEDIVIIGGGIIGASTAYFLSKEGRKVKVIERDPTYKNASFPLSLGGFRRQFYQKEKKSGQISIISSVAGYRGLPAAGAYCASKSALTSFTESLYFEMKRKNVRVSLISPGFIKTPMTDQNDFPMPMIRSPEFAAEQIYIGLTKKKGFEIHFPKVFTYMMKFLRILPSSIYFKFLEKGMKKINY